MSTAHSLIGTGCTGLMEQAEDLVEFSLSTRVFGRVHSAPRPFNLAARVSESVSESGCPALFDVDLDQCHAPRPHGVARARRTPQTSPVRGADEDEDEDGVDVPHVHLRQRQRRLPRVRRVRSRAATRRRRRRPRPRRRCCCCCCCCERERERERECPQETNASGAVRVRSRSRSRAAKVAHGEGRAQDAGDGGHGRRNGDEDARQDKVRHVDGAGGG